MINRHKTAKHFEYQALRIPSTSNTKHFEYRVTDESLEFSRKTEQISAEEALHGIYVIRTPVPADQLNTAQVVEPYKGLKVVEADFRSLKAIDLDLRPIHHYLANWMRAWVFITRLAFHLLT